MKNLLRTILDKAEENKLMYRVDAYQLWNELSRYDSSLGL